MVAHSQTPKVVATWGDRIEIFVGLALSVGLEICKGWKDIDELRWVTIAAVCSFDKTVGVAEKNVLSFVGLVFNKVSEALDTDFE